MLNKRWRLCNLDLIGFYILLTLNRFYGKGRHNISSLCKLQIKNASYGLIHYVSLHSVINHSLSLLWRHNGHDGVSNHQPHHYLLSRLFRRRSKKTSMLRETGLCAGNSPVTGEFPAQMASNAENASNWWRHHVDFYCNFDTLPPSAFNIHLQCLEVIFEMTNYH